MESSFRPRELGKKGKGGGEKGRKKRQGSFATKEVEKGGEEEVKSIHLSTETRHSPLRYSSWVLRGGDGRRQKRGGTCEVL